MNKIISKSDIDKAIEGKGNFMKIQCLNDFLRKNPGVEIKKYISLKLAETYEHMEMLVDAAKMFNSAAMFSVAFSEKIKYHIKEAELYIKTGMFDRVDEAVKKALIDANAGQKAEIFFVIKDFYKKQALFYEKERKINSASRIYEKLLRMNLYENEKKEIREKLINIYEKLGKFKESYALKKSMEE